MLLHSVNLVLMLSPKEFIVFDEVKTVYLMSGSFDLLVIIEGKSLKNVADFVARRLSTIEGVTSTRSHFMLKPYKKDGIIIDDKETDHRLVVSP